MKKVAIVHDWLTNMGGAEQVVINLHNIYKDAPIYTTFYTPKKLDDKLKNIDVRTCFLQGKKPVYDHKKYFPLMPFAFSRFNMKEYDVILSSSSSCAKGVRKRKGAKHICYVHTPMRYAYEFKKEYTNGMNPIKLFLVNILLFFIRIWDKHNTKKVDYLIANSTEVQKRIKNTYNRDSIVINPPVRTNEFKISNTDKDYYFIVSRLVGYKRFDLAVKACTELNKELIIIGDGPERKKLESIAGPTIKFLGKQDDETVKKYMSECKALLFPGLEDFGIVPVEAQACGRPVICYGKGGVLDTVIDGKTGLYFNEQSVDSLKEAIIKFESMQFDKKEIREHALKFDEKEFQKKIKEYVEKVTRPKVFVNGKFLTQKITGVQRYAVEIIKEMDKFTNKNEIYVLVPNDELTTNLNLKNIQVVKIGKYKKQLWEQISLPLYVKKHNGELLNMCNIAPVLYPGYVTIHDIAFKVNSNHLNRKFCLWYRIITRLNIKRYKHIFTVSNFSKNEIMNNYNVNASKISITYNSANHLKVSAKDDSILKQYNLKKDKYYLTIGSNSKHKNLNYVYELAKRYSNLTFVITGDNNSKIFKENNNIKLHNLIFTGYLSDQKLVSLYLNCKAFIFPSLYEGFGIPPLEAVKIGCNYLILSDIDVLHEIYGNDANYIDEKNEYVISDKLKKINREKLLNKYTWENSAKIIYNTIF